jgi:hypothetical protein
MTETPDDIQQKIAQIEAMRSVIGDATADAAIAALRAQQPPSPAHLFLTGVKRAAPIRIKLSSKVA